MWDYLSKMMGRPRTRRHAGEAHMTFGQTSLGRSLSRTGLLLKKQLWIWPIAAVILLAIIGFVISRSIHHTMEDNLRSELQTLLTVERSMLEKWFKVQESSALGLANNREIRKHVNRLLETKPGAKPDPASSRRPHRT
jgi:eukaryotic-like serine/threonine-protein kinase